MLSFAPHHRGIISKLYDIILAFSNHSNAKLKCTWEEELGMQMQVGSWEQAIERIRSTTSCACLCDDPPCSLSLFWHQQGRQQHWHNLGCKSLGACNSLLELSSGLALLPETLCSAFVGIWVSVHPSYNITHTLLHSCIHLHHWFHWLHTPWLV